MSLDGDEPLASLIDRDDAEADQAIPLTPLVAGGDAGVTLEGWLAGQPPARRRWVEETGFEPKVGQISLISNPDGTLNSVLAGLGDDQAQCDLWDWAAIPGRLPQRTYRLFPEPPAREAGPAALGWALAAYRFQRYSSADAKSPPRLVWPRTIDRPAAIEHTIDRPAIERAARATFLVRDLINTPAGDLGPGELAAAAQELAAQHGAECRVTVGEDLLDAGYPAIHAVGRASTRAPRLIDLTWGDMAAPKVTLIGKGVCFDTGGLDLKPAAGMKLMKKDMGGAAQVLGLASMVMAAALPIRLRVLIPAVENCVAGNALFPLDVVTTRSGKTVEIGNTDAEGRVVLADALAEAGSEKPALIVDFATLTGAARVALGTEVPALFCNDDDWADSFLAQGGEQSDPLWRLPLWPGYRKQIDGKVADLTNAPDGSFGGAITAALFLQQFVGADTSWAHIDLMAWNPATKPGRPEGGEAQGIRAVFAALEKKFR